VNSKSASLVQQREGLIADTFDEYLKASKKAYASIDKNELKNVRRLEKELEKAQKKAYKTMNPTLEKEKTELLEKYLSHWGMRLVGNKLERIRSHIPKRGRELLEKDDAFLPTHCKDCDYTNPNVAQYCCKCSKKLFS